MTSDLNSVWEHDRSMVDQTYSTAPGSDRALLRAVLRGEDLQQIADARGLSDQEVRTNLHRVFVLLLDRRAPSAGDPGRTAPRP